ncbi:21423_t:CDS:1, partial [Gigaspora margarita]
MPERLTKFVYIYCNYHFNLPYQESVSTIASHTHIESYSFKETYKPDIGIWKNSDFDSNYKDDIISCDEYITQESDEEISSSNNENFLNQSD